MQAILRVAESAQRMIYRIAGKTIVVDAQDAWSAKVIEKFFAGSYLTRDTTSQHDSLHPSATPDLVISDKIKPPEIPHGWPQFEVAGGGTCFTDGITSYIDIEGSVVAIGKQGHAPAQVWTQGLLEVQSPELTRVVTYAMAAAMRRRHLFELHSGAVVNPENEEGVLIIGPSGSGKSTLTVHLAAAGWSFLTDDVLLLGIEGRQVKAWPLRRCFAITSETFAASTFLKTRASLDYSPVQPTELKHVKKLFVPQQVFNSNFKEHCIPRKLFFSQLNGAQRSQVIQLSTAEAMSRLIRMSPWSCYDRTTATDHLGVLSALAAQSKAYSLLAGEDLLDPDRAVKLIASYAGD